MAKKPAKCDVQTLMERRALVWELYLKLGANYSAVARELRKKKYERFGQPVTVTIREDVRAYKEALVKKAEALFSHQKVAVADFINKSFDLRERALNQGDLRLANIIDKDLLKFVGVNLDKVEVVLFAENENGEPAALSFPEMMNRFRRDKGLPAAPDDDF